MSFTAVVFASTAFCLRVDGIGVDGRPRRTPANASNRTTYAAGLTKDAQSTFNVEASLTSNERINGRSLDYGTFACMRYTGDTCGMSGCRKARGPTVCEHSFCMCQEGYCASGIGKCEADGNFTILGKFAIKFENPWVKDKAYLGAAGARGMGWTGVSHVLAVSSDSTPSWNVASVGPDGLVRIESAIPGHEGLVMTIYNNRRRARSRYALIEKKNQTPTFVMDDSPPSLIQEAHPTKHRSLRLHRTELNDNSDLWPMLMPLSALAMPLDATFQIRINEQAESGKSLVEFLSFAVEKKPIEIWDPQWKVAIVNVLPNVTSGQDKASKNGIAECNPSGAYQKCDNVHSLIVFEPRLPLDMDSLESKRIKLHAMESEGSFAAKILTIVLWLTVGLCFCCCCWILWY